MATELRKSAPTRLNALGQDDPCIHTPPRLHFHFAGTDLASRPLPTTGHWNCAFG